MGKRAGQKKKSAKAKSPRDKSDNSDNSPLPRAAWAFHEIPEDELSSAWQWEMEIEGGSGEKHWLEMLPEEKAPILLYKQSAHDAGKPVQEKELERGDIGNYIRLHDSAHICTSQQLHLLEIDWGASLPAIKKALANWVDNQPTWKASKAGTNQALKGRHSQHFSWLADLAILRVSESGVTCSKGNKLLTVLFSHGNLAEKSKSAWEDAQARTKARYQDAASFYDQGIFFLAQQKGAEWAG